MSNGENEHEFRSHLSVLEFRISALKEQVEKGFMSMGAKIDNFVDFQGRHDTSSARNDERVSNMIVRIKELEEDVFDLKKKVDENTMSLVKIFAVATGASLAGAAIFSIIQLLLK